jgi:hypothetical protein
MEKNTFIAKAVNELLDDGFSIKLIMTRAIDGKYGGWFDDNKDQKEFVVAMKRDCAFEIFVHEYSHYLQWKHHRKFFSSKVKGCDILFSWLDGKRYSKKVVSQAVRDVIELEWHCERIALQTIKKYKLDEQAAKQFTGLVTPDGGYYVGIDNKSMMHPQTLLCYELNDKPLPMNQGYPLRLIIPVKYGVKHIKRIGSIFFSNIRPPDYWHERGYDYYCGL